MSAIIDEQKLIEDTGDVAWSLICSGKHDKARSKLRRISNSFCVGESVRVCVILEAEMLSRERKQAEAVELIRQNMSYLWGSPDALIIQNRSNAAVDAKTKRYHIEIQGGTVALGGFTAFGDDHVATFDVLANSEPEAMQFIEQVCTFVEPEKKKLLECKVGDVKEDDSEHRGVVRTYPFAQVGA